MTESNVSTVEIPDELRQICALADRVDEESAGLFPPEVVSKIVNSGDTDEANMIFLEEWLDMRKILWDRRDALLLRLPVGTKDDIPLWMTQPFALTLSTTWGTGLAKAISDCEKWLASQ